MHEHLRVGIDGHELCIFRNWQFCQLTYLVQRSVTAQTPALLAHHHDMTYEPLDAAEAPRVRAANKIERLNDRGQFVDSDRWVSDEADTSIRPAPERARYRG